MPISYPNIAPTTLEFIPAQYDTDAPSFRDIVTSPRIPKSNPSGPVLKLGYENIAATNVLAILTAWDQSYSGVFPITLPAALVSGVVSTDFAGRITTPKTTDWRFKERPSVNRFVAGVASISVVLVGEFYRHGATPPPRTEPEDFDPLFSNVSFLLQPEQAAGSTAFVDISNNPQSITNLGAAAVVDTPEKAISFNGSTQYLSVLNGEWANLTGIQGCIEFIFRTGSIKYTNLASRGRTFGSSDNWGFFYDYTGIIIAYAPNITMRTSTALSANTLYHLAVTNNVITNRVTLWLNGLEKISGPGVFAYTPNGGNLMIGGAVWDQPYSPYFFNGNLIAMRVTKNSLRYTVPFTPPSRFLTAI